MDTILYDLCGAADKLRFSPHCWRAKMALAHKGLPFGTSPTRFTEITKIGSGTFKTVPVLIDRGQAIGGSFDIAVHLDRTYPDLPLLFEGPAHEAASQFAESWAASALHPLVMRMMVKDIHSILADEDQSYFRESREARLGKPLEEAQTGIEPNRPAFLAALAPARQTLKRNQWLGGANPLFIDYIFFGTLQWVNVITGLVPVANDDPVADWFERCLDLHDGLGRAIIQAA